MEWFSPARLSPSRAKGGSAMKKIYAPPQGNYISLAAAENLAIDAEYYSDGPQIEGGIVSNPFD